MIDAVSAVDYGAAVVAAVATAARLTTSSGRASGAEPATFAIRRAITIGTGCGMAALVMWAPATRYFVTRLGEQPVVVENLALALMMVAATAAICASWWTLLPADLARRRSGVLSGVLAGMLAALAVVAARATPEGDLVYEGVSYVYFILTYGWYGLIMVRALPAMRSVLRWATLWTIGSVACGVAGVVVQLAITVADWVRGVTATGWSAPAILLGAVGVIVGSAGTTCTRWAPALLEFAHRSRARQVERALEPLWEMISRSDGRQLHELEPDWSAEELLQRRVVQIHDGHRNAAAVAHPQLGSWVEAMARAYRWSTAEARLIKDAATLVDVLGVEGGERVGTFAWAGMPGLAVEWAPISLLRWRGRTRLVRTTAARKQEVFPRRR